jgi:hypothetical protein
MGGTGHQALSPSDGALVCDARPTAGAEMHARTKCSRQPDVAGYHKGEAAGPADPRQIPSERLTPRLAIVPKHDPGEASWQTRRRSTRVGKAACVGEQPQSRQAPTGPTPCRRCPRPGD